MYWRWYSSSSPPLVFWHLGLRSNLWENYSWYWKMHHLYCLEVPGNSAREKQFTGWNNIKEQLRTKWQKITYKLRRVHVCRYLLRWYRSNAHCLAYTGHWGDIARRYFFNNICQVFRYFIGWKKKKILFLKIYKN